MPRKQKPNETIRSAPCQACPYRMDVASGVWGPHEYEKLRDYDQPTALQPFAVFACHATPDHLCAGWAKCHMNRGHDHELLALRLCGYPPIPMFSTPLWPSGNSAADHGQRDCDDPSDEAVETVARLMSKYPRLTEE